MTILRRDAGAISNYFHDLYNAMTEPIVDSTGRIVAPPQVIYPERPRGPWNQNTVAR